LVNALNVPAALQTGLQLPVIAAPMFLVSGPDLVAACCANGVIGTFPALNQRTTESFNAWLEQIEASNILHQQRTAKPVAAYGVNLIVHKSNPRLHADLEVCAAHRVPLIITSLGAASSVVQRVHDYGGVVFHDVATVRHAEKAADAGVDGLILVCNGAGGHAGLLNPFAFIAEVRRFYQGTVVLAGCIGRGQEVAAAQMLGADFAYMGTRFIATQESLASDPYKQMLLKAGAGDIAYTPAVSGIPASFLRDSLKAAGFDVETTTAPLVDIGAELAQASSQNQSEVKAWRDVWSAGQGVASIDDVPSVQELVTRLRAEYQTAVAQFAN